MTTAEDVNQMASLMLALTQPDTETIRQAELALKPILKDARSIPALIEVLKGRGVQVRQLDWFLPETILTVTESFDSFYMIFGHAHGTLQSTRLPDCFCIALSDPSSSSHYHYPQTLCT